MNLFALSSLLTAVTCAMMAGLVYLTNRTHRVNQLWALLCAAVTVWGFGGLLVARTADPQTAIVWWRIAHAGVVFIPVFFYHFTLTFLELRRPKSLAVVYALGIAFSLANLTLALITNVRKVFGEFYYNASSTPLYAAFMLFFIASVVASHVALWQCLRRATQPLRRIQLGWFLFATAVGFAGGATCFLPVFGVDLYPYGNFAVPMFPLIMTYAILRYRLMDVNLAVARGLAFLFIYTLVIGVPFFVGMQYEGLWQEAFGRWWWIAPVAVMGFLASLAPFAYIAIQQRAETRLLKDQRRYQATLLQASQGMTEVRETKRLLRLIVHVMTKAMGVSHASIYLEEPKEKTFVLTASRYRQHAGQACLLDRSLPELLRETRRPVVARHLKRAGLKNGQAALRASALAQMEALQASVVVPSFLHEHLIGFLVLGDKANGEEFSAEDIAVLSTLANQAAVAIESARFYEEEQQRQAALFHAASLASLGTMVSAVGHQINNRFNVVSVVASMQRLKLKQLLDRPGPKDPELLQRALEESLAQFDSLQEEAVRGGQIVSAIRKIARPPADGYKPLSLRVAIQTSLDVLQHKIHLEDFDLDLQVPEDLPPVVGDLSQLGECFLNLIDNAHDAIKAKEDDLKPEGFRGRIRVIARATEVSGSRLVVVEVSDNGIGMGDKEQERAFVPFFTTKATGEKGTGLGLYVIKKIIEAHHGTISLSSTYGAGTTFTIQLPSVESRAHGERIS